ncbi:hypothetical protein [Desulfoscipio gibsoniae]|uniref:Uncharacterized protein n=1 Tax=Desulfoscipio gibsoniae DSM 7213 TaxID=767817 RepID=R4KEZ0_9FIRM|nr:hypothetical protein [Desulfoscipio gibsoniae]AGL01154.1 hypothetical protein Desgi_1684 [Desulfoscipio gibsoniae DSM 7213]
MDKNYDRYTGLVMDIRDCLTVIQGLIQVTKKKQSVDNLDVIMEHLNIADQKLKELSNSVINQSAMQPSDYLNGMPPIYANTHNSKLPD